MTKDKIRLVATSVLLLAGVPAADVSADVKAISDPKDSRGKLDIIRAEARHMRNVQGFVKHVLTFEDRNGPAHGVIVGFRFRVPEKGLRRRTLFVKVNPDGGLYGEMHRPGVAIGYARVWKPNGSSIAIAFPTALLSRRIEAYKWTALTDYIDREAECADSDVIGNCIDRAPNKGWVTHRL
ncbi:MAG: hypothetical protein M3271_09095 [Actinomycetota bacterium]|nr:hypothetical protein [Actinomycetota bacterium]